MTHEKFNHDTDEARDTFTVIDSHVHFWHYEKMHDAWITKQMKELQQDYLPKDLQMNLKRNGVDKVVAVQANQTELETQFLIELSKSYDFISSIVGWVDLANDNIQSRLQYFSQFPVIKGWRHFLLSENEAFFTNPQLIHGIEALGQYDYTFDLLVNDSQLEHAAALANRFPEQKFVLDHAGKPAIKNKKFQEWEQGIKAIADSPNVYCKLSGLFTEAVWKKWSAGEFYPYFDTVFKYFGANRLMFGSDWPVMLLSGMYVQWKSLVEKYMQQFSEEDKAKVMGLNAKHFYNL